MTEVVLEGGELSSSLLGANNNTNSNGPNNSLSLPEPGNLLSLSSLEEFLKQLCPTILDLSSPEELNHFNKQLKDPHTTTILKRFIGDANTPVLLVQKSIFLLV